MRFLAIVNKAQFNPVNTRCGTHHIPTHITQLIKLGYHIISLSNVVSHIVSKVLANRVKPILPNIIFDSQSAFVPNRFISDNTSVAYEMLHRLRNKRKGKIGHMAVKLIISKVYDRVEWEFLRKIMVKLGLAEKWVNLAV